MSPSKGNSNKPSALFNLKNQLNNLTNGEEENKLKLTNCKCRNTDYFQKLTKIFKRNTLSLFHMNVFSLTKNFDDFNILY